jgi:hypothetical protein
MAARRAIVAMILSVLGACEESAPQPNGQAPSGRRTSTYGKAMDRAEDLQKEVAEYNRQIERTIEQGSAAEPSKPPAPKRP